jgi:hemerythrin-like domain-containing protein
MKHHIIDLIRQDHDTILQLLVELDSPSTPRQSLYGIVKEQLHAHMCGEEATIYERMRREMPERIEDSLAEHNSLRICLGEMDRLKPNSEEWVPYLQELRRRLQFHIESEERLLKAAESSIGDAERYEMAEQFQRAKEIPSGNALA